MGKRARIAPMMTEIRMRGIPRKRISEYGAHLKVRFRKQIRRGAEKPEQVYSDSRG